MAGFNVKRKEDNKKKRLAELKGGDSTPRAKVSAGAQVFILIPSIDEEIHEPYRFVEMHFEPTHVCGRLDAVEMEDGSIERDVTFSRCPRCQPAREAFVAEGFKGSKWQDYENHPLGPRRKELTEQMSGIRGAAQVLDVSCFFSIESDGRDIEVEVDPERLKLLPHFVDLMAGREPKVPTNKLPPELVEAAQAGPLLLTGAQTNFKLLSKAVAKLYKDARKKDKKAEPLDNPTTTLMIIKAESAGKFKDNDKLNWTIEFKNFSGDGWEVNDAFVEAMMPRVINLHNPVVPEGATPSDYNAVLARMPTEMLEEYLKTEGWKLPSAHTPAGQPGDDDGYDDDDAPVSLSRGADEVEPELRPEANGSLKAKMASRQKAVQKTEDEDVDFD